MTGGTLAASFLCGIAAAICIAIGGKKTKRTKEVEEKLRAVLAAERKTQSNPSLPQLAHPLSAPAICATVEEHATVVDEHMVVPRIEDIAPTTKAST